ncbi:DUF6134 family protein [Flavobacterium cerinum]|uniref:DUF3108 domain-containing protein n=1 Tax=Flavobacterium cerinum TaxID=2502784 RepID=A0A3S3Q9V0_9FLAO|nr:DUF6134 family protein [Flavobacterium cerinum]RWX01552.1 hypothetical protein EPI11_06265 [Flavobacterium cerinum]
MAHSSNIFLFRVFREYTEITIGSCNDHFRNQLITKKGKLLLIPLFFFMSLQAQEKNTNYTISRNGNVIGEMQLYQKVENDKMFLKISSQVNTKMVFDVDVKTEESSYYKNGKLISSYVKRHVNGREKVSKSTFFTDPHYKIIAEKKEGFFKEPIYYNLMMLYSKEPTNQQRVYSDSFQKFLAIEKLASHSYRIKLPDGNYNDYHFQNGICQKVEIHSSLYTIQIQIA